MPAPSSSEPRGLFVRRCNNRGGRGGGTTTTVGRQAGGLGLAFRGGTSDDRQKANRTKCHDVFADSAIGLGIRTRAARLAIDDGDTVDRAGALASE